jgi:hypothetical protein
MFQKTNGIFIFVEKIALIGTSASSSVVIIFFLNTFFAVSFALFELLE